MRFDTQKDWNVIRSFLITTIKLELYFGATPLSVLQSHGIKRRNFEELRKHS